MLRQLPQLTHTPVKRSTCICTVHFGINLYMFTSVRDAVLHVRQANDAIECNGPECPLQMKRRFHCVINYALVCIGCPRYAPDVCSLHFPLFFVCTKTFSEDASKTAPVVDAFLRQRNGASCARDITNNVPHLLHYSF